MLISWLKVSVELTNTHMCTFFFSPAAIPSWLHHLDPSAASQFWASNRSRLLLAQSLGWKNGQGNSSILRTTHRNCWIGCYDLLYIIYAKGHPRGYIYLYMIFINSTGLYMPRNPTYHCTKPDSSRALFWDTQRESTSRPTKSSACHPAENLWFSPELWWFLAFEIICR